VQSFGPICFVACSAETASKAQTKPSIKAGPRLYLFITRDIKYVVVLIYKDGNDISIYLSLVMLLHITHACYVVSFPFLI
jgi:hypothetical protein